MSSSRLEPTLLNTITDDKLEWIQIDCGGHHTAGLTKKGEVFTWGCNYYGQLGHGDYDERTIPTKVASLDGFVCYYPNIMWLCSYCCPHRQRGDIHMVRSIMRLILDLCRFQ